MTGARVPMLSTEDARVAAERAGVIEALADLNVFRVLLRRERPAKAISDLLLSLLVGGDLDTRLRELVIMRIGWVTGSVYEWTQHWKVATDVGVDPDDLLAVRNWTQSDRFDELDRAVLGATDQALRGERIDDDRWSVLADRLGDDAAVELVLCVGSWSMISTVLRSLDVALEDGVRPWPPDDRAP